MRIVPRSAGTYPVMDKRLLDILCCPVTRVPVRLLDAGELATLNRAIADGRVHNAAGSRVQHALAAGLMTTDRRTIYPVEDEIPVMLADEAMATAQIEDLQGP
jgi:uncharacterized protein YbaR (Trm112 family)